MRSQVRELLREALKEPAADFRQDQWKAIELLVRKRARVLLVQRTGWGKSMVYFLATRLLRKSGAGPTLIICPLLVLMRNQMALAKNPQLRAETINSANQEEWHPILEDLLADKIDILLISPERLANEEFRNRVLPQIAPRVGLFVVDEAHCISDWGHDFRPDYRRIVRVLQALPENIPVLATTATANDRVVNDIRAQLGSRLQLLRGPLARSSLKLQNIDMPDQVARMAWLAQHVSALPGSGVIYTLTVEGAQRVANWLISEGIDAAAYWGNLEKHARLRLEDRLLNNDIKALVATSALGMGYDKPDLGFVIHFQRPGSVVHYYQQVGRAGRALENAYGIMLCGTEDRDIIDYFIRTAFPSEKHANEILDVLSQAHNGCRITDFERHVNLPRGQISQILKLLTTHTPSPVSKQGNRWYRTHVPYTQDRERIEHITRIRREEQAQMMDYMSSTECLMVFLQRALDDLDPSPCGRCATCRGAPLVPETYAEELAIRAVQFSNRSYQPIKPRISWQGGWSNPGWDRSIPAHYRLQEGRSLCRWGDPGWGIRVREGKQQAGHFDHKLVRAVVRMVQEQWKPYPPPEWVTCVPSLKHPDLVPSFADRVADSLNLPFEPCVRKVRSTEQQKMMRNSSQRATNLDGAFAIGEIRYPGQPVLLIDDMVDSRWTITAIGVLLGEAGSGSVFPLALADTSSAG